MNSKPYCQAFRLKMPVTQRIDHKHLFGEQSLAQVLLDRQIALHQMLLRTPRTEHETLRAEWKARDERIVKAYRGEIDLSEVQFFRQFYTLSFVS